MRRLLPAAALAGIAALAAAAAVAAPPKAKVLMRTTPVGSALVDVRGHTLYLFTIDRAKTSSCYGACAAAWPPFLTSVKPVAGAGVKQALLGTSKRKDGKLQVTYAGHPLYFFAQDAKAGEVNGQGTNSTWFALRPTGKRITTQPPGATTPVSTGGGGGGYDGGGYYPP
jgi:predicted lipoprotein with Yx(FWY)xxD motif